MLRGPEQGQPALFRQTCFSLTVILTAYFLGLPRQPRGGPQAGTETGAMEVLAKHSQLDAASAGFPPPPGARGIRGVSGQPL